MGSHFFSIGRYFKVKNTVPYTEMKLEDLRANAAVRGILTDGSVTVVNVQLFGSEAIELTYKTSTGNAASVSSPWIGNSRSWATISRAGYRSAPVHRGKGADQRRTDNNGNAQRNLLFP